MTQITAVRFHDISVGHTVTGHESKCAHLHGHNYRVHFKIAAKKGLDDVGRVLDFGVIKSILCEWLETYWDHKFLVNELDPRAPMLKQLDERGVVLVGWNPTAENMAEFLLKELGPKILPAHVELVWVKVEETYKCSVEAEL